MAETLGRPFVDHVESVAALTGAWVQLGTVGVFGPVTGMGFEANGATFLRTAAGLKLDPALVTATTPAYVRPNRGQHRVMGQHTAGLGLLCGSLAGNLRLGRFDPHTGVLALAGQAVLNANSPTGGMTGLAGFGLNGRAYLAGGLAVQAVGTMRLVADTLYRHDPVAWTVAPVLRRLTSGLGWASATSYGAVNQPAHGAYLFGGTGAWDTSLALSYLPATKLIHRVTPQELVEVIGLSVDSGLTSPQVGLAVCQGAQSTQAYQIYLYGGFNPTTGWLRALQRFNHYLNRPQLTGISADALWGATGVSVPQPSGMIAAFVVGGFTGLFAPTGGSQTLIKISEDVGPQVATITLGASYSKPAAPVIGLHAYLCEGAASGNALTLKRFTADLASSLGLATVAITTDSGSDTTGMTGVGISPTLF